MRIAILSAAAALSIAVAASWVAAPRARVPGSALLVAVDRPDAEFAAALNETGMAVRVAWAGGEISPRPGEALLILDWNGGPVDRRAEEAVEGVLGSGGLVVADPNTLLNMGGGVAGCVSVSGWEFPGPTEILAPGLPPVGYDGSRYGISRPLTGGWIRVASFSDGSPAAVQAPCRRGIVLALLFNPVWPAAEGEGGGPGGGEEPGMADLVARLVAVPPPAAPTDPALLAVGAAAGAAAGAALEYRRKPWDLPILGPLIWRVGRGEAQNHRIRAEIMDLLWAVPGLTEAELASELGIPRSTVRWHLFVLESRGLLATRRVGRRVVYFPPGREAEALRNSAARKRGNREIVRLLKEEPGLTAEEIARKLGASLGSVERRLRELQAAGVVVPLDRPGAPAGIGRRYGLVDGPAAGQAASSEDSTR